MLFRSNLPTSLVDYMESNALTITEQDWRDYLKRLLDFFMRMGNHIQPLADGERKYIRDSNLSTPVAGPDDEIAIATRWPSVKAKDDGSVSVVQSRMVILLCAGLSIHTYEDLQKQQRYVQHILKDAWNQLVESGILTRVNVDDTGGYNNPIFYTGNKVVGCYYLDLSPAENNGTACLKRTEAAWVWPASGRLLANGFC